jgi:lipopolysaccharide biosynthesis regulator YciM
LESIACELSSINKRGDRFDEAVTRFVDLASAQREAVGVLSHQIESSKQTEARSVESIEAFRQAVTTFTEASTANATAVNQLNRRDDAREERMEEMSRQHNQRFTMMFVLALFLSVAAVMIGLNAMMQ